VLDIECALQIFFGLSVTLAQAVSSICPASNDDAANKGPH